MDGERPPCRQNIYTYRKYKGNNTESKERKYRTFRIGWKKSGVEWSGVELVEKVWKLLNNNYTQKFSLYSIIQAYSSD